MSSVALLAFCFVPAALSARPAIAECGADSPAAHNHAMMQHQLHSDCVTPTQPGQGAFAAIQEIVGILEADPKTDWSKVNIDALRRHLVDMSNVTLAANIESAPVAGGVQFKITGAGPVQDSIHRMVFAHAAAMNGVGGWRFAAAEIENGASLTVWAPANEAEKLRGLGFFGVLTRGMHHQQHHLMIARGENPHE
jgi:hypothetical protein